VILAFLLLDGNLLLNHMTPLPEVSKEQLMRVLVN
jgi:hypothetical protein